MHESVTAELWMDYYPKVIATISFQRRAKHPTFSLGYRDSHGKLVVISIPGSPDSTSPHTNVYLVYPGATLT